MIDKSFLTFTAPLNLKPSFRRTPESGYSSLLERDSDVRRNDGIGREFWRYSCLLAHLYRRSCQDRRQQPRGYA
jgi:hypothetical protein